ncbi:hypothetical protein [Escherichia coli]|uniref:hypothetical protein n=1 Tax=Escherichia coli TaxID=562 RepID=UPI00346582DF
MLTPLALKIILSGKSAILLIFLLALMYFELLNFYQRYPEMKHSPLLYRITNDMNRSGLLSSESAKGFFSKITPHISFDAANEIDYLSTKPQEQLSVLPEKKERRIATLKIYRKSFAQQR